MSDVKSRGYACPRCTVGRCTPRKTTFAEVYHGQLLSVPNVSAFVCDVCHFAEYDPETLETLWEDLYGEAPQDDIQSVVGRQRDSTYGEGSN